MTREDVAEKVANNVMLQAVARIGMALVTIIGVPIGSWYFSSTASAISDMRDAAGKLTERVSIIETKQNASADRGAEVRAALTKLQDQQALMMQQLAGIAATLRDGKNNEISR